MYRKTLHIVIAIVLVISAAACKPRQPKVTTTPDPGTTTAPVETTRVEPSKGLPPGPTVPPPVRVEETPVVRPVEDAVASSPLDDLNRSGLLKPAFFVVDSHDLNDEGRMVVSGNADVLKKYATWQITVEGHADERGTAEYNLALGEKRANAVKTYLISLGVSPDRLKVVSYGKEFPFDPGHDESAWSKNRRAHFVITAK